jgi:hypothetical protein
MLKHEVFEELCALSATGQLSAEDELRLNEHIASCESCRAACNDYSVIFRELPAPERGALEGEVLRQIDASEFRERFLARARAEGRRFSEEAERGPAKKLWWLPRFLPSYQAMAAAVMFAILLTGIGYRIVRHKGENAIKGSAEKMGTRGEVAIPAASPGNDLGSQIAELNSSKEALEKTISDLRTENTLLSARLESSEKEISASMAARQASEQALSRANEANTQLAGQMEQNGLLLAELKGELEKMRNDRAALETQLSTERAEVGQLSEQVRLQTASLDRDRDLLLAGHDITDLMGARNLHIIDVRDADGKGQDRKSFGRVFYTEGKSLIFYAFDLDEKKVANAKYTFEAWGERLGQPASVKSLGMLYADDKDQRRWVLKVDDPRQLAEINSVFVTLEPHNGSGEKPQGHRILYAFLGGQPNHP